MVSASTRPSFIAAMASAAIWIALIPCSGQMPAWAGRPCTVKAMRLAAGARVISSQTPSTSRTRPRRARSRPVSKCLAPSRPYSSQMVSTTSMSPCGIDFSRSTRIASRIATTPALSSPPSTLVPSVRTTSPSTTGRIFSAGPTVSMWPESRNGGAPGVLPGKRASRLPVLPSIFSPAPSTSTLPPMDLRIASRRRAIVPSRFDGLEIETSSRNSSFSRGALIMERSSGGRDGGAGSAGSPRALPGDGPDR